MRNAKLTSLALLLSLSACTCEPEPQPERKQEPSGAEMRDKLTKAMPVPPGDLIATDKMGAFLPDELAGFTSTLAFEARETPIPNGGTLHVARREYAKGDLRLQVEITDSLHAPAIAKLVEHQHTSDRPVRARIKPRVIRGRPALSQHHVDTKTAIVNVLVRKRLLINVKVLQTDKLDDALAVADAIDYEGLAALLPEDAPHDSISADFEAPHGGADAKRGEAASDDEESDKKVPAAEGKTAPAKAAEPEAAEPEAAKPAE